MQTLSPISLVIGIAAGICGASFVAVLYVRSLKPKIVEVNDIMASSVELLDALGSAGVVLSLNNRVVRATGQALTLGVLDGWQLSS